MIPPEANNNDAPQSQNTLSLGRAQHLRRLRRTEFGGFLTTLVCFTVLMYMKQYILAAIVSGIMLLSLAIRLAALSASRRRQHNQRNRIRLRFSNPRALYLSLLDRDFNQNDYELLSALDNDLQSHRGLSDEQINRLPVYTYCEKKTKGSDTSTETKDKNENEIEFTQLDTSGDSNSHKIEISVVPEKKKIEPTKDICSVCLETLATGDKMRTLNCLHGFHKDCIDRWLKTKASCPICNFKIRL